MTSLFWCESFYMTWAHVNFKLHCSAWAVSTTIFSIWISMDGKQISPNLKNSKFFFSFFSSRFFLFFSVQLEFWEILRFGIFYSCSKLVGNSFFVSRNVTVHLLLSTTLRWSDVVVASMCLSFQCVCRCKSLSFQSRTHFKWFWLF